MKGQVNKQISAKENQAVEWFQTLQNEGRLTEDQLVAYVEWLQKSPRHEELIARCETAWELMGALENDPEFAAYTMELLTDDEQPAVSTNRWKTYAAAASILLFIAVMTLTRINLAPQQEAVQAGPLFQTATGQQEDVSLDDGSSIILNTSTELHVEYTETERHVYLQRGEALFDVAPDPERPFVVFAGAGEVRALGTKFNVRVKGPEVIVSLLEGKVEVKAETHMNSNRGRQIQKLLPGEQTRYTDDGEMHEIRKVDTELVMQWQSRKLSFTDMPLQEVVEEINRYTPVKLVIDDPEIANERLSAYFLIDNVDSFLTAIEEFFGIESARQSGKIMLSKADAEDY